MQRYKKNEQKTSQNTDIFRKKQGAPTVFRQAP